MVDDPTDLINDETLRLALTVAELAYWDHDLVTNEVRRSPSWGAMLGYSPGEVDSHRDFWLEHIHSEDRASVDEANRAHEEGRTATFRVEHRMRTKDGQWKWILNWGRIVQRDEDGKPERALGFHLDITDRKHAEAAMSRSEKLATIGTLAGGIAHDFNNLLTVIRGNLQLARSAGTDAERDRRLDLAEQATRRSQELTGRLLTFARGGAPTIEPVDIEQVLGEARDLVLSGSNCRLRIEAEPGLRPAAGSPNHLIQVFQSLLMNADQAMPDGGIITASIRRRTLETPLQDIVQPGEYIEIVISDEGPGIGPEIAAQVFDPFFTTRPEGKGLGLATAHSIVEDHKGLLDILNADQMSHRGGPVTGASLRVLLPVAATRMTAAPARAKQNSQPVRGHVLVVDDDELVRELAVCVIGDLGCRVSEADDGAKAIEMYRLAHENGEPFDAVLMDLTIPGGMGGKEAVAGILALDPQARVIVSSGYSDDPVMADFREYGFCACLTKPYELGDVRTVMGEVLGREDRAEA